MPKQSGVHVPTLQDVAARSNVSTATVSRCLNKPDSVRAQTRERVEQAIAELGYTPNFGARALASNRTGTIGIIIPTMDNAIFAHGIQAMEELLSEQDITLLVASSGYSAEREEQKVRALVSRGVDGLALIGLEHSGAMYDFLLSREVPFVLLWNYAEDSRYPCIGFDNRNAAAIITQRVLDAGHRRIAMIAGRQKGNDRATQRVEGVVAKLAEHGLSLLNGGAPIEVEYTLYNGDTACITLMSGSDQPTAIICGNDVLAAGAMRGVRSLGLRVPEDVSIVGFDDIDLASALEPALTTVHMPHRRMGRAAVRMLQQLPELDIDEARHCFETWVVERGSLATIGDPVPRMPR